MTADDGNFRLREINLELRALETRQEELVRDREHLLAEERRAEATAALPSPHEKIALFLSLFRCRGEVYPRFWENPKSGKMSYSPVDSPCSRPPRWWEKASICRSSTRSFSRFRSPSRTGSSNLLATSTVRPR